MAYTPGPWVYDPRHPDNAYSDDATGLIVATAAGFKYAPRAEAERHANTRLIAAAPDLLEALSRITTEAELDGLAERAGWDAWIILARAAIAKATGEAV